MFEKILSIVGIRVFLKSKGQSKHRYYGRGAINYFKTKKGRRINFIVSTKRDQTLKFDVPIEAMKRILNKVEADGPINWQGKNNRGWKIKEWRDEE